jgi:Fe-S cluster assembly iron-binding protein IscA
MICKTGLRGVVPADRARTAVVCPALHCTALRVTSVWRVAVRVFAKDGVEVVVDSVSYPFIKGATVDYSVDMMRAAFVVCLADGEPRAWLRRGCVCP